MECRNAVSRLPARGLSALTWWFLVYHLHPYKSSMTGKTVKQEPATCAALSALPVLLGLRPTAHWSSQRCLSWAPWIVPDVWLSSLPLAGEDAYTVCVFPGFGIISDSSDYP